MAMPIAKRCVIEDLYAVELGLDELIAKLQEDKARLTADGWTDLSITLDGDGETEVFGATLWGTRIETDQEAEDRASRAHHALLIKRRAELVQLAKEGPKTPSIAETKAKQDALRKIYNINPRREDLIVRVMRQCFWTREKALEETEFLYTEEK